MVQNNLIASSSEPGSSADAVPNTSSHLLEHCGQDSILLSGNSVSGNTLTTTINSEPSSSIPSIDQEQCDNMPFHTDSTSSYLYNTLDNCKPIPSSQSVDNSGTSDADTFNIAYYVENEYPQEVRPRTRNDSSGSIDTIDSSSSGEIFNSNYTDTISSTASSAYLIKSAADSDTESQDTAYVSEAVSNDGYMSYSSTEMLNDNDDGSQEDLLSLKVEVEESESEPMLNGNDTNPGEDQESGLEQNLNSFVHHSLSPIHEHQVLSFVEEDQEPKLYTKITDNIIVADESFLFNSVSNLGDLEFGQSGKRALTMHNIHERSSFLDLTEVSKVGRICQKALIYLKDDMTLGSLASLNTITAKENAKDPTQSLSLISGKSTDSILKKANYMKNLFALSISITLLYIAIGSVRNLQSSINHEGGVGVIGLAVNFVGYVIGSMFSSSIVQNFHPRKCIIVNLFPNLLYVAANLYPAMWIIVPISLIQGLSLAVVSNATSTYITFLAKGYAEKIKGTFSQVSGKFFGTYCLIYQSHIIVGNLIASFILEPPGDSEEPKPLATLLNTTAGLWSNASWEDSASMVSVNQTSSKASHLQLCGAGFCQHFEIGGSRFAVSLETKMLLFGVYIGCIVLAVLNAFFLMEPLNKNLFKSTVSPLQSFKSQMSSLVKFSVNVKFLLLLPLLMYSAMQFAFVSAEFMKGYITCPLGIHMIGYTMICFGICSSASSYFCGLLNKYVGRIPFVIAASLQTVTKIPSRRLLMNPAFSNLLSVCCNG